MSAIQWENTVLEHVLEYIIYISFIEFSIDNLRTQVKDGLVCESTQMIFPISVTRKWANFKSAWRP